MFRAQGKVEFMISFHLAGAVAAMAAALTASGAQAQAAPFEGPYAGPFVGALEHHFYLETTDVRTGDTDGRYFRDWQIGGGGMAGYDLAVSERLRVGVEGALQVGGGSPEAFVNGARYQQNARFGYRLTGKVGLLAAERVMFFVKGGYGGDRFEIDNQANVADATNWQHSFVVGTGAQIRLDPSIELRVEYEHLDTSSHAFFIGLPIRF